MPYHRNKAPYGTSISNISNQTVILNNSNRTQIRPPWDQRAYSVSDFKHTSHTQVSGCVSCRGLWSDVLQPMHKILRCCCGVKNVSSPSNSHQKFSRMDDPVAQSRNGERSQFFLHRVENFRPPDQISRDVGEKHDSLVLVQYFPLAPGSFYDPRPVRIV